MRKGGGGGVDHVLHNTLEGYSKCDNTLQGGEGS